MTWMIDWMVFDAAFNSISVISRRQLTLFMLSWVSPVLGWALKCLQAKWVAGRAMNFYVGQMLPGGCLYLVSLKISYFRMRLILGLVVRQDRLNWLWCLTPLSTVFQRQLTLFMSFPGFTSTRLEFWGVLPKDTPTCKIKYFVIFTLILLKLKGGPSDLGTKILQKY